MIKRAVECHLKVRSWKHRQDASELQQARLFMIGVPRVVCRGCDSVLERYGSPFCFSQYNATKKILRCGVIEHYVFYLRYAGD